MSTATVSLREIAAQWRAARRIYPIYAAIVRQFEIGAEPCRQLESPIDRNDPEILEAIDRWFDGVDERCQPWHLRQALQTAHVATEDNLRGLLRRFLDKEKKSPCDRDKVDFLLVQYFAQCAPHAMHNRPLELDDVSQVLEPVLGETVPHQPKWLDVLDNQLQLLAECRSLGELLDKKVLADVRQLKEEAGEMYFGSGALLAFTRFNFISRHTFFRLMHSELQAMRHALQVLQQRGTKSLDCTRLGFAQEEPIAAIQRICHDWRTPFRAPYAAGKPFAQLIAARHLLEEEAAKPEAKIPEQPQPVQAAPQAADSTHEVPVEAIEAVPAPVAEPSISEIPVYDAETPAAEEATASSGEPDLQACLEHIAEQLIGDVQPHPTAVATVLYQDSKVLLSSWEVAAYVKGGNDAADTLQRAVAARTLLLYAVERKKKGVAAPELEGAIKLSHAELAMMQERIAEAKEAKNIDAAVNLAATCKRLMSLIDEAEKLGSKE